MATSWEEGRVHGGSLGNGRSEIVRDEGSFRSRTLTDWRSFELTRKVGEGGLGGLVLVRRVGELVLRGLLLLLRLVEGVGLVEGGRLLLLLEMRELMLL